MKQIIILLLTLCSTIIVDSQPMPDSIRVKYHSLETDAEKGRFLNSYFGKAPIADSTKTANAFELLSWFKKNN